jgi:pseudouridine-5'-phosphate glycosidase
MSIPDWLELSAEVRAAVAAGRPIVALESTLISHGLPWPTNLETAKASEAVVREANAVPATIAILNGRPTVGLNDEQIRGIATNTNVMKVSRRDIAGAMARKQTGVTTVAATMFLADRAGIRVFATGGIGGAHRSCEHDFDISADLVELAKTPVMVVCAGAKSVLDLPKTLEILETLSVPVIGYQTDRFPAFYVRDIGLPVSVRVNSAVEAAQLFATHLTLGGGGLVLAQAVSETFALSAAEVEAAFQSANAQAIANGVLGPALTPFLLARLAELTNGKSLRANQELIVANARLAANVATSMR